MKARLLTPVVLLLLVPWFASAGGRAVGTKFDPRAKSRPAAGPPKATGLPAATELFTAAATNQLKPEWLQPPTDPFRLGPGDKLELEIVGQAGSRTTTFLCPDGKLYFDLLPGMDLWGLTLDEAKEKLVAGLAAFYARPQLAITLTAVESKRVWVMGRLNKSGVFPLHGPMTIIEAISKAGGLFTSRFSGTTEELADLNHSFLVRRGEMLPVNFQKLLREGNTSHNIYLQPDDFIYLPSSLSSEVYVLGAVHAPRPVGFIDRMSLTTAIAKALGSRPEAYLSHVAIVRGSLSEPRIAVVDFKAILHGQAPDVLLEARDIVYVPPSPYRTLERYVKLITDTFVRTVAANEGGRAVDTRFGGVGVSNPISQ